VTAAPRGARSGAYWKGRAASFAGYYRGSSSALRGFVSRFLDRRTRVLAALMDPWPGGRVLDLACGSGVHLGTLGGASRRVVGVDYSEQMLRLAGAGLERGQPGNASARRLPFRAGSFDALVSMGLLDYVQAPEAVLAECHRVLGQGGVLLVSAPKAPSAFFLLRTRLGERVKAALFDLPPIVNVLRAGQLDALLERGGFVPERVTSVWTTMWMVRAVRR
jgi:ubiquinone/menaquinone biosynthesis C-methylase UbiE